MPMPPQGGAPEQGGEEGKFTKMVTQVSENLTTMQQLLGEEGVPEDLTAKLGELNQTYQAILGDIMKSMGGGAPAPAAGRKPMVVKDAMGGVDGVPV